MGKASKRKLSFFYIIKWKNLEKYLNIFKDKRKKGWSAAVSGSRPAAYIGRCPKTETKKLKSLRLKENWVFTILSDEKFFIFLFKKWEKWSFVFNAHQQQCTSAMLIDSWRFISLAGNEMNKGSGEEREREMSFLLKFLDAYHH